MGSEEKDGPRLKVLIAGGGVAALEGLLALRELAGERVAITLLAPQEHFVYRALLTGEPFGRGEARHYPVADIAREFDAELVTEELAEVDPVGRIVRTARGTELGFDALLVAIGAQARAPYEHVTTFALEDDTEAYHGLLQDVEDGYAKNVVLIVPPGTTWTLPIYELALMTAEMAYDASVSDFRLTVVTPEDSPMGIFGPEASAAVAEQLERAGVEVLTSTAADVRDSMTVDLSQLGHELTAARLVALPVLAGRPVPGLPADDDGFLPVDSHCAVIGVEGIFAAGDGTTNPVKQGGLAAQQADAAAQAIAARAGAAVEPEPFHPILRGLLRTGSSPKFMRADLDAPDAERSATSQQALWWPPSKIAGRYLGPYLAGRDHDAAAPRQEAGSIPVEVDLEQALRAEPRLRRRAVIAAGAGAVHLQTEDLSGEPS